MPCGQTRSGIGNGPLRRTVGVTVHATNDGAVEQCDPFRHPAVLAKQATTLAEASGGRFELGLGSGSMADELAKFDISTASPKERVDAFGRTLAALREYWSDGDGAQVPTPTDPIPIVLGGVGPRMLDLVRRYADWWNLPATYVHRLPEFLPAIGSARASVQQMVGFVRSGEDGEAVTDKVCGDAGPLKQHFTTLESRGAQRF